MTAKIMTLLLLLGISLFAQEPILISVHRTALKPYEPIFLKMMCDDAAARKEIGFSSLECGNIYLMIASGKDTFFYKPPIHADYIELPDANPYYETIVISRGKIITEREGSYSLYIANNANKRLSNTVTVTVAPCADKNEVTMVDKIKTNPVQYGLFIYLDGGDQFSEGKKIIETLAGSSTGYARWARPAIGMNLAQNYMDWKNDTIARKADLRAALSYAPDNECSENQRLKFLNIAVSQNAASYTEPDVKEAMIQLLGGVSDTRSDMYSRIQQALVVNKK